MEKPFDYEESKSHAQVGGMAANLAAEAGRVGPKIRLR